MAVFSSILAWRGAWRATVHRVTKSWTQVKWLSTSINKTLEITVIPRVLIISSPKWCPLVLTGVQMPRAKTPGLNYLLCSPERPAGHLGPLYWSKCHLISELFAGSDVKWLGSPPTYTYLMIRWHHRFDGHEFEQALGVGDGQGSLACFSLWGCKESDTTEWPNWTELNLNELNIGPGDFWLLSFHSSCSIIQLRFLLFQEVEKNQHFLATYHSPGVFHVLFL